MDQFAVPARAVWPALPDGDARRPGAVALAPKRRAHDAPVWTFEPVRPENVTPGMTAHATERVTVPVSGSLSANNSEALRDAALAGLGIALLPDFSAQASLQAGRLLQVLPQWKPVGAFAEQLYAIRPYSAHVPRAVTAFVAYLREALAGGFGEGMAA